MPKAKAKAFTPAYFQDIREKPLEGAKQVVGPIYCAEHYPRTDCGCNAGPQVRALLTDAFEIFFGGQRGGGKTATGRLFLIKGNPDKDPKIPVNLTYVNHPLYRALILRKNIVDLNDWIDKAMQLYSQMGAVFTQNPHCIRFPHPEGLDGYGATFYMSHLDSEDAFEKYQGQEFHRMVMEELTQIPSEELYLKVLASCRSTILDLVPQVFVTANPGGPGHAWVKNRFVAIKDTNGNRWPADKPYVDPLSKKTRIFIPAKLTDNPFLGEDYKQTLMMLPEHQRRAWLDGDWDAMSGQYFTEYRPSGPMIGEDQYPWAKHTIPDTKLPAHWARWMGMDWGYKHHSVCYWAAQDPNGQVHMYRELALSRLTPQAFGVEIALASIRDLDGLESHTMSLYLSPDAFQQRTDEKTIADQIVSGIRKVMGADSAHILTPQDVGDSDGFAIERDFDALNEFRKRKAGIVIRRAQTHRVAGWQYVQSLMRFKPLLPMAQEKFDHDLATRLAVEQGAEAYFKYVKAFEIQQEVLPKLLIHVPACIGLSEAIQSAVHDERKPEDVLKTDTPEDDRLDAARYLLMGHRFEVAREPAEQYIAKRLEEARGRMGYELDGNSMVAIANKAKGEWGHEAAGSAFALPRSSRRRRVM